MVSNFGVFIKDVIENIKSSKVNENINSSMLITNENKIEIAFVGDAATGAKTNLVWALVNEKGSINHKKQTGNDFGFTIGYNISFKKINKLNQKRIIFLDLQGLEIMLNMLSYIIRGANIIVLGYDITNKKSFINIDTFWFPHVKELVNKNTKYYLIGNKVDMEEKREVLRKEAEKFAIDNNFTFFEVSAYYYINVNELLEDFIKVSQNQK